MSRTAADTPRPPAAGAARRPPLGHSPFGATAPSLLAAVAYGSAALVWVLAGTSLPGGRWLAVHLFTLGVLTNVVLVFSEHFGRTLTRTPVDRIRWQAPVVNAGILIVLTGLPSSTRWATGTGASIVTGVVLVSYWRLRRMRRQAVGARFGWVVRAYERAHGAFVHGAILGVLTGLGVVTGNWWFAARTAHLHVNILGWGGLTLLATIVFFGPTMVRARIVEGADERAARALRHGATGLTVGVLLLFATGIGAPWATPLRLAAAAALGVYARGATVACLPIVTAARGAKPSVTRWPVIALGLWFPVVAWADVAVVAVGRWRLLDAVGLAMFLGVLTQTITAVLAYLAPMLRHREFGHRERMLARLGRGAGIRAVAWNAGTLMVVLAALVRGDVGAALARGGWATIAACALWLLAVAASPASAPAEGTPA